MERIPVQLVVCDIDDTLIHKDDHLKEETIQVIQELKRRGIQFTLATGRLYLWRVVNIQSSYA